MNNQLFELYSSKWDKLCTAMLPIIEKENIKPTNPLLLYINGKEEGIEDYNEADIRVMVFGQETNKWHNELLRSGAFADIQKLIDEYDYAFNTDDMFCLNTPFWKDFKKFRILLGEKYPIKTIRYVWNNIVKIGRVDIKGCPPDYIYDVERKYFSVIKEEINIIKPNVILFLTGPNYDNKISNVFGQVTYSAFSPLSERELAKISIPGVDVAFRTYHPNYFFRNNTEGYYDTIISEI